MRYIGIEDSENNPIFEGDLLEIMNVDDLRIDFLEAFDIDKITVEVSNLKNQIGVEILFYFYSKHNILTNKAFFEKGMKEIEKYKSSPDYTLENELFAIEDLNKRINGEKNDLYHLVIRSWHDISTFYSSFIYCEKRIVKSKLSKEEKIKRKLINKDTLEVNVDNFSYPANTHFLVELNKKTKDRVLEVHNGLYSYANGFKGDFTHIELSVKKHSLFEIEYVAKPVNVKGELTLFASDTDYLSNDKSSLKETVIDKLFLGRIMSLNLFLFFENEKCKITILK